MRCLILGNWCHWHPLPCAMWINHIWKVTIFPPLTEVKVNVYRRTEFHGLTFPDITDKLGHNVAEDSGVMTFVMDTAANPDAGNTWALPGGNRVGGGRGAATGKRDCGVLLYFGIIPFTVMFVSEVIGKCLPVMFCYISPGSNFIAMFRYFNWSYWTLLGSVILAGVIWPYRYIPLF